SQQICLGVHPFFGFRLLLLLVSPLSTCVAVVMAGSPAPSFRTLLKCHHELSTSLALRVLLSILHISADELADFDCSSFLSSGSGLYTSIEQFFSRKHQGESWAIHGRVDRSAISSDTPQY